MYNNIFWFWKAPYDHHTILYSCTRLNIKKSTTLFMLHLRSTNENDFCHQKKKHVIFVTYYSMSFLFVISITVMMTFLHLIMVSIIKMIHILPFFEKLFGCLCLTWMWQSKKKNVDNVIVIFYLMKIISNHIIHHHHGDLLESLINVWVRKLNNLCCFCDKILDALVEPKIVKKW